MVESRGYAAKSASTVLEPFAFQRRDVGDKDIQIEIDYCGVCHSDIHQARNEWGGSLFPMVPGHEIVGTVTRVGKGVSKFKVGDLAGIGCLVDSCRTCPACVDGDEQFCQSGMVGTYNSKGKDGLMTYGGYSTNYVVDEKYSLTIPKNLDLKAVAPLLCAGITTFSPLRHWKVGKGHKIGVIGLGGLGHMAVKFAKAFGAEVTVFSTSHSKEKDAALLGAHHFVATKDANPFKGLEGKYDFLFNTVSAPHDLNGFLKLLGRNGTMIIVGVPPASTAIDAFSLIANRRSIGGSLIGGIAETQEMLNYCGAHNIVSEIEQIDMKDINTAYERMLKGDVRYRFVIDAKSI